MTTLQELPLIPHTQTTLCFLFRNDDILLAMKKRGFGKGKWNGTGGKLKEGESIEEAAIRETTEEIKVTPTVLEKVAVLYFYFPHNSGPIGKAEETTVFFIREWTGTPRETEEMRPQWFPIENIPYQEMWDDDMYWLPKVLTGKRITGKFLFDDTFHLTEYVIEEV